MMERVVSFFTERHGGIFTGMEIPGKFKFFKYLKEKLKLNRLFVN
jgi:hypothetical protein